MPKSTVTSRDLRRLNRRVVLHQMATARQPISRLELSQQSGLSTATVTNVVGELLAEHLIVETGLEASEGGRPRSLLSLNRTYGYVLGCELGETRIVIDLFDLLLEKQATIIHHLSDDDSSPSTLVTLIVQGVSEVLSAAHIAPEHVLGMGMGVPGIVEHSPRMLLSSPNWGWQPAPFMAMLKRHFDFPIFLENGAKTMTLAELHALGANRPANIAVINIGTGVGAGITSEGKLYRGATNSAGEVGHTIINLEGRRCRCGHDGCLEAYVGAPGILQTIREYDASSPWLIGRDQRGSIAALAAAAQQGDPLARQVLAKTALYLGVGLANLVNLFNLQLLILAGWVGLQLGPLLLDELRQVLARTALQLPLEVLTLSVSQLGEDAASYGAAQAAFDHFLTTVGRMGSATSTANVLFQSTLP
jgi:predicted NBD/HSP70 family sugar kinase